MDDLTELESYHLWPHTIRLLDVEWTLFVSMTNFDRKQSKALEVLGVEHGLLIYAWCIDSLRIAEA